MFIKILQINFFLLFLSIISLADVIKSIEVTGNKRFSKESIIVFGKINLDTNYNDNELNELIKKLYSTNFFKQINLDLKNNILLIDVKENPIIEDLEINGIKNSKMLDHIENAMQLKSRKSYVESIFLKDNQDFIMFGNQHLIALLFFSIFGYVLIKWASKQSQEKQYKVVNIYAFSLSITIIKD
jgi:outer membrane protein insertion porin family